MRSRRRELSGRARCGRLEAERCDAAGDKVEDFTLQNQDGKTVHLSDYKEKPVVLFFYPRADTPGCTIESCGFAMRSRSFRRPNRGCWVSRATR